MISREQISKILPTWIKKIVRPIFIPLIYSFEQKKMIRLYKNFIFPGDLVFDIGAAEGFVTEVFLKLGSRVICVEPQPYCINILKSKFSNSKNVTIVEEGAGDREGVIEFFICTGDPEIATFSKKWKETGRFSDREWDKRIKVSVVTLDSLISKFGLPKFCKIDVEGFEYNVLQGLSRKIPLISFEFHKELLEDTKSCIRHILTFGEAKFKFFLYRKYEFFSKKWLSREQLVNKLESIPDKKLTGDIFVKFES